MHAHFPALIFLPRIFRATKRISEVNQSSAGSITTQGKNGLGGSINPRVYKASVDRTSIFPCSSVRDHELSLGGTRSSSSSSLLLDTQDLLRDWNVVRLAFIFGSIDSTDSPATVHHAGMNFHWKIEFWFIAGFSAATPSLPQQTLRLYLR